MKRFLAALATLTLAACQNAVVFTTSSLVGIEVGSNGTSGEQAIKVGYQRTEGVIMPVNKAGKGDELRDEAYSVLSIMELDTGSLLLVGLGTTKVRQVFATGEVARGAHSYAAARNALLALSKETAGPELSGDGDATAKDLSAKTGEIAELWGKLRGTPDKDNAANAIKELIVDFDPNEDSQQIRTHEFRADQANAVHDLITDLEAMLPQ